MARQEELVSPTFLPSCLSIPFYCYLKGLYHEMNTKIKSVFFMSADSFWLLGFLDKDKNKYEDFALLLILKIVPKAAFTFLF